MAWHLSLLSHVLLVHINVKCREQGLSSSGFVLVMFGASWNSVRVCQFKDNSRGFGRVAYSWFQGKGIFTLLHTHTVIITFRTWCDLHTKLDKPQDFYGKIHDWERNSWGLSISLEIVCIFLVVKYMIRLKTVTSFSCVAKAWFILFFCAIVFHCCLRTIKLTC